MYNFPFFDESNGGWRRSSEVEAPEPKRWGRALEAFELDDDVVPGETVLRDLAVGTQTNGSATRILARFVTLRFLTIATQTPGPLVRLRHERSLATPYTSLLRAPPAEARALRAIVALGRHSPPRRIMDFLDDAGTAARASKHTWGAFALQRFAYRLAVDRGWHAEGARAAEAIALMSAQCGAIYAPRLWRRRARVLRARAARV